MNFVLNVLAGAGVVGAGLGLLIALIMWGTIILNVLAGVGIVGASLGLVLWLLYDVGAAVRGQD